MGKIAESVFRTWYDGDIVNALDYEQEREIIRIAINDTHDRYLADEATIQQELERLEAFGYEGVYDAAVTYGENSFVLYDNALWIALQTTTGNTPAEGAYWETLLTVKVPVENAEQATTAANNAASTATTQGNTAEDQGNLAEFRGETAQTRGWYAQDQGDAAEQAANFAQEKGQYAETEADRASNRLTDLQNFEDGFVAAEDTREANETTRQANETTRQTQESDRQTNTATAITNAETATTNAQTQADFAQQVAEDNETNWLSPVATVASRDSTYPEPVNGDTVRVTDDQDTYRFITGTGWQKIDSYAATLADFVEVFTEQDEPWEVE